MMTGAGMLQASKERRPLTSRDPAAKGMPLLALALHTLGVILFLAGAIGGYVSAARLLGAADMLGQFSALIPDRPADLMAMPDQRIAALAEMIGDGPGLGRQMEIEAWTTGIAATVAGIILWLLCAALASTIARLERIEATLNRPFK